MRKRTTQWDFPLNETVDSYIKALLIFLWSKKKTFDCSTKETLKRINIQLCESRLEISSVCFRTKCQVCSPYFLLLLFSACAVCQIERFFPFLNILEKRRIIIRDEWNVSFVVQLLFSVPQRREFKLNLLCC